MSKKIYLPFVKVQPISELQETSTLLPGGSMLIKEAGGISKKINTEVFYQMLNNFARPISPTDPGPFTANRWYKPTTSNDDPGTNYPNAGNLKAKSGFDSLFWYDGTTWTKTEVELPDNKIDTWSATSYGSGKQVFYDGKIYESNASVISTDVPGISSKWDEKFSNLEISTNFDPSTETKAQGGKQIAQRYDYLKDINNGFVEKVLPEIPIVESIDETYAVYGGKFLENDNTITTNVSYPEIGTIYNLDVTNAGEVVISGMYNLGITGKSAILGIKNDDSIVILLNYSSSDFSGSKTFDLKDYKALSIQVEENHFPNINLHLYTDQNVDARNYLDERLSILDYFVNPTEIEWTEIAMPQPIELDNEAMGIDFHVLDGSGFAYGVIPMAELSAYDFIKMEGGLDKFGGIWLWGQNDTLGVYTPILTGVKYGSFTFPINKINYEMYGYTRYKTSTKFYKGKIANKPIELNSVKNYIDNHVSRGSAISNEKSTQIRRPSKVLRLEFTTTDPIPVDKTTIASGKVLITDLEGLGINKFATIEVQGSSSAFYPKKNRTLALYNDEAKTESFKLRIGNWVEHSEFVYKANWIDATQARNLISKSIWEDIVQSRAGYPKRENEIAYLEGYTGQSGRFDSGALTHVDGVPCELYINGGFYGIGTFNLGKKRENYDLKSSNQNHIQIAAETHANFYSYNPLEWEIRNPKIPDSNFTTKINTWFAANALSGSAFKDAFPINHDVSNAVDFFLLVEFIQSPDMYIKNLMITSWDGVKFYFLPYDMDTTFGLEWDGGSFTGWTTSIRSTGFWSKFYNAYTTEIKARYLDLKTKGVFTLNNVYKHADKINKTFGLALYQKEQSAWASIPSNSTVYTGFPQLYDWVKNRLIWLDSQYT